MVSDTHNQHEASDAHERVQQHAKLLRYRDRQALVMLVRDDHDALAVVVQLWVAATDEQLRVSIKLSGTDADDDINHLAFVRMTNVELSDTLDTLGVGAMLDKLETGDGA